MSWVAGHFVIGDFVCTVAVLAERVSEATKTSKGRACRACVLDSHVPAQVFAGGRWACVCHFSRLQFLNDPRSYPGAATRLSSMRTWSRLVRRRCAAAGLAVVRAVAGGVAGAHSGGSRPAGQPVACVTLLVNGMHLRSAFASAQGALNGYQLDKAHKFAACLYDEFERLAKVGRGTVLAAWLGCLARLPGSAGCLARRWLPGSAGATALAAWWQGRPCTALRVTWFMVRSAARAPGKHVFAPAVPAVPADWPTLCLLCALCRCPRRTRSPASACSPLERTCWSG